MIGLLNAEMGNIRSVYNAIYSLSFDIKVVKSGSELGGLSHLIIPGVGSYRSAMENINGNGLKESIRAFAESGKPVLGICLGMQLLSDHGEEHGNTEGLGLVPGKVTRFPDKKGFPLPHVGWNTVSFKARHPVFEGVKKGIDCYFVHSYRFICNNRENVYATTDYGEYFTSIVGKENVIGFQFHPEKSQANGLRMLENFCQWDGRC